MITENDTTADTTTKDTKQAATSPPAGAVHVEASSSKVQQASEKTKGLELAPTESWTPLKRSSFGLHQSSNERAGEELQEVRKLKKTDDATAIADATPFKKSGTSTQTRQEKRRARIVAQTAGDTNSPTFPEQDDQDEDDEDLTPGAVRVPGMDRSGRGDEEEGLTIMSEQNSTIVAQLVVEENEREQIEDLRQQFHDEQMEQVPKAEIVEDDGSNTRRRALLLTGIVAIILAIILGTVFGTRDTSPNTVSVQETTAPTISSVPSETISSVPSETPLNNNICEEAHTIALGDAAIGDSLQNAIEQVVVFCELSDQHSESQPGLWYKVRG
jgi:hypothetical protein